MLSSIRANSLSPEPPTPIQPVEIEDLHSPLEEIFVRKIQELIAPFFEKLALIKEGKDLEAVSIKPSGIWYPNVYAAALVRLGETPIPVRDKFLPASRVHRILLDQNAFYTPRGNPNFWETVPSPDALVGISPSMLQMKKDVRPSEAFQSFQQQLSFLDCNTIIGVARFLAILERFGTDRFDEIVTKWRDEAPIRLGDNINPHFIKIITKTQTSLTSLSDPLPEFRVGQLFFMNNHPTYSKKHPHGESNGFNLICIREAHDDSPPLFTGFGLDPEGVTLENVAQTMLEDYNQTPIPTRTLLSKKFAEIFERRANSVNIQVNGERITFTEEEVKKGAQGKLKSKIAQTVFQNQLLPYLLRDQENTRSLQARQLTYLEFVDRDDLFLEIEMFDIFDVRKIDQLFNR